jgi:Rrf2 family protein
MSDGVEWALHSCTVLATLPSDQALPAAKLAELHDLPPAYLAKHLQAMAAAGITEAVPGPRGGYRLARPPAEISLLDVVQAVDGSERAFRCSEIRQRGPVAGPPSAYRGRCGIARAMDRAEDAWRAELAATTVADLVADLLVSVPAELLQAGATWVQQVEVRRRRRRAGAGDEVDTRRSGGRGVREVEALAAGPPRRRRAGSADPGAAAGSARRQSRRTAVVGPEAPPREGEEGS